MIARVLLPALLALACSGPAGVPPKEPAGAAPARRQATPALGEAGWGELVLPTQLVVVRLPEAPEWRLHEQGSSAEAVHAGSASRLFVRSWRAPRIVAPSACEREARLARSELPPSDGDGVFDRRRGVAPEGWDVLVVAGARPAGAGGIEGWLLAVAATVGRCMVVALTTVARGEGAEAEIGDRLALLSAGTIDTLVVRSPEDRARR